MLKLWNDDAGALIAMEWLLVGTILVIGIIPGLVALRNAIAAELQEQANALSPGTCPDPITCTPPTSISVIEVPACN
jgi:hypothetical protein